MLPIATEFRGRGGTRTRINQLRGTEGPSVLSGCGLTRADFPSRLSFFHGRIGASLRCSPMKIFLDEPRTGLSGSPTARSCPHAGMRLAVGSDGSEKRSVRIDEAVGHAGSVEG